MILATLLNSYPRIGDRPSEQVLRRAIAAVDRGEAPAAAMEQAEDELTRQAIREQATAGLDLLTDGQVRWHDPVSHLARGLTGFRAGGLLRYLDTNTYYRQPEAIGPIGRERPILVEAWRFATAAAAPRPVKSILTGPLTIARLSRDGRGRGLPALARDLAAALNREVIDLEAAGAPIVQIDEPTIARHPGDLELLRETMPRLLDGVRRARVILATSFGDALPLLSELAALPGVGMIGFDLVAARGDVPAALRRLPAGCGILLGVLDGRNTRLEDPDRTYDDRLRPLLDALRRTRGEGGPDLHLAPNHGLEFLPRDVCRAKLARLAALRDRMREALA
jgi:5-methyltetrahydropteroyltriglutamate--homocysteine methyltransferase